MLVFFGLCCLIFLLSVEPTLSQESTWQLLKQIKIATPTAISVNKQAHIFVADKQGNLTKYDSLGNALLHFSMPQIADAHLVEAWQTMRIVVFYKDLQQIIFLDRFLNLKGLYDLEKAQQIGFVRMACPSPSGDLWLFDNNDFHLKKYNPDLQEVTLFIPLDLLVNNAEYQISFMREYQNLLLVNNTNEGVLVFDNLGNYKHKIPYQNITFIGTLADEIYFLQQNTLIFWHLYQQKERKIELPKTKEPYLFGAVIGNKYLLLTQNDLQIYQIKP